MSSSKVFKEDPLFTPMPLVQSTIAKPGGPAKTSVNNLTNPPPATSPPPAKARGEEPSQVPPIDLQAIKNEAYNQGVADTAAKYQAEFQRAVGAFAEACQKIDEHRKILLKRSRGDIINLIIAFSKKILGQELSTPRNIIATTLQAAIEQAIESEEYYVTLHPDDLTFAEAKVPDLIAAIRGLERIVLKTDKNLTKGGCLLESSACSVDATIETQMESMKEFLEQQSEVLLAPKIE